MFRELVDDEGDEGRSVRDSDEVGGVERGCHPFWMVEEACEFLELGIWRERVKLAERW